MTMNYIHRTRLIGVLAALLVALSTGSAKPVSESIPGQFIIKFKQPIRFDQPDGASAAIGTMRPLIPQPHHTSRQQQGSVWEQYAVIALPDTSLDSLDVIHSFPSGSIEWVEPVVTLEFFDWPEDSLFTDQWYLHNTGQEYLGIERISGNGNDRQVLKRGVSGVDIDLETTYEAPPADRSRIVIAIIDSGVDPTHPELSGQFWVNEDELPGNGLDDDHNGYVDDTLGYDVSGDLQTFGVITGDNDPTDRNGHGTHVAGIVGSRADQHGVVGVAPNCHIMAVKIRPNATNAVGAAGIIYAVNNGAHILNCSWGTPYESAILADAIAYAVANGVIPCVAAGNNGNSDRFYPAAVPEAFTVGASGSDGFMTSFSSFGPHLDLVAPGQDILSLRAAGTDVYATIGEAEVHIVGADSLYYLSDGTSMACPVVAGAAGLLWSERPDLSAQEIQDVLRSGAIDLIDPRNTNESYPGPDTISGFGLLSIDRARARAQAGGLYLLSPTHKQRYADSVMVQIASFGSYSGGYRLEIASRADTASWLLLASGPELPNDTSFILRQGDILADAYLLQMTDDLGDTTTVAFTFVNQATMEITSPLPGLDYRFAVPITGTVHGSAFDSLLIQVVGPGLDSIVYRTTLERFAEAIFSWEASGIVAGEYQVIASAHFGSSVLQESIPISVTSAFAAGWPRALDARTSLSPVAADIDNDGTMEIFAATTSGLFGFSFNGQPLPNFPALPGTDVRCIPAIHDLDGNGTQDVIVSTENGIWAFQPNGLLTRGWPRFASTPANSFGFPTPLVGRFSPSDDSVVALINGEGRILAYHFDGNPYFYSLQGRFANFYPSPQPSWTYGGNAVTAADLDGDELPEVIAAYSTNGPLAGVGVFDARTGEPAYGTPLPQVLDLNVVYGMVLGDLTGDGLPEIVTAGGDQTGTPVITALTNGNQQLPGWPRQLPDVAGYRGTYPALADIDLDGRLEVICCFFEFDLGVLYIFRADGTPYVEIPGRPTGEAFRLGTTFGTPVIADVAGDRHPEIIFRSGYIFPGTGPERVNILDHTITPISGWPVPLPTPSSSVFSTIFAPFVDDFDDDGLVELALLSDANNLYIWDMEASSQGGRNTGRLFADCRNSLIVAAPDISTDIDDQTDKLPTSFALSQNYPNPFNPTTSIVYDLPKRAHARLDVFNLLGQHVRTLVDATQGAGRYTVLFDGRNLASGLYIYRFQTGDHVEQKKMVLIK